MSTELVNVLVPSSARSTSMLCRHRGIGTPRGDPVAVRFVGNLLPSSGRVYDYWYCDVARATPRVWYSGVRRRSRSRVARRAAGET